MKLPARRAGLPSKVLSFILCPLIPPILLLAGRGTFRPKGIGWLSWKQLRKILEITRGEFRTQAERKFIEDLIVYLDYKIREAERIRTERKQLSFW